MLQTWSPKSIVGWVQHFCDQYGIVLLAVDASHTSQIDPETGLWGWRDRFDRSKLWVRRGEEIVAIHTDLDAATPNLKDRFADRVASVRRITAHRKGDGYVAVVPPRVQGEGIVLGTGSKDKRAGRWTRNLQEYHLLARFGSAVIVVDQSGNVVGAAPSTRQAQADCVDLYRLENRWVTKDERYAFTDLIRDELLARRNGNK